MALLAIVEFLALKLIDLGVAIYFQDRAVVKICGHAECAAGSLLAVHAVAKRVKNRVSIDLD